MTQACCNRDVFLNNNLCLSCLPSSIPFCAYAFICKLFITFSFCFHPFSFHSCILCMLSVLKTFHLLLFPFFPHSFVRVFFLRLLFTITTKVYFLSLCNLFISHSIAIVLITKGCILICLVNMPKGMSNGCTEIV